MTADGSIKVRPAEFGDSPAIAAILRQIGWFEHVNEEPPTQTERRVCENLGLCNADSSHTVLVVEHEDGAVAGYIAVHWMPNLMAGLDGYVSELFVGSEKGKGIGTTLLEAIKHEALQRGCKRLMLFNGRSRESYARGFYPKHGWKERQDVAFFMLYLDEER